MRKLTSILLAAMMLLVSCAALADAVEPDPVKDVTDAIEAALESGTKPADVFGEDAKAMLALYMPEGTDLDKVEIGGIDAIKVEEATDAPVDQEIPGASSSGVAVIVLGDSENGYTSIPVETKVIEDKVYATLSPAMQAKLTDGAVCVMTFAPADAIAAPDSKTVTDLTEVATIDPDFTFAMGGEQNEESEKLLSNIIDAIVNGEAASAVEAFDADTQAKIAAILPEDTDLAALEINEVAPVETAGVLKDTTKVAVKLPTEYTEDMNVATLFVGSTNEAVATKVVDGVLIMDITKEAADAVANGGTAVFFND